MKHLIDDALNIGRAAKRLLVGFSVKGLLIKVISVSRPNWPETFCIKAADSLAEYGIKSPFQFETRMEFLSYIDVQLTRYAARHPVVDVFPQADEALGCWLDTPR